MASSHPKVVQVVLDAVDHRELAEFYRELLGLEYREGDEPPAEGEPDDKDWLVLRNPGGMMLAFQQVDQLTASTWPTAEVPQQLHLDTVVPDLETFDEQCARALELGAELLLDRREDPDEPLKVFADPAGHPFCIFVE